MTRGEDIFWNPADPYRIIGESSVLKFLLKEVERIAKTNFSVLLTGETGVGKELFARCIHAKSNRANMPFIPVNCGGITESLLESELFGYAPNSFTGASQKGTLGKIQAANVGTLFLDEIGELSQKGQQSLLRVLGTNEITRVGEYIKTQTYFRLICATNANLEKLLEVKKLRRDFYYRISIVKYEVPPLRERSEDVALLANYFMDRYCKELEIPRKRFTNKSMKFLEEEKWPGNIRELETVIQRCTLLEPETIECDDLKRMKLDQIEINENDFGIGEEAKRKIISLAVLKFNVKIADFKRYAIKTLMEKGYDKLTAAKKLGISKSTLYRRLGIEKESIDDEDVETFENDSEEDNPKNVAFEEGKPEDSEKNLNLIDTPAPIDQKDLPVNGDAVDTPNEDINSKTPADKKPEVTI